MADRNPSAKQVADILIGNNQLLEENNKLLKEILITLHKVAVNTS
jgi:hypothetical protein